MSIGHFGLPVPTDLPPGEPSDWLTDSSTAGSNVLATAVTTGLPVWGTSRGGEPVLFAPGDPAGTDQLVINLFALCGVMHDVLYALGFREADGNFQVDNRGRGGVGSDRVEAIVHPDPVWGTMILRSPPPTSCSSLTSRAPCMSNQYAVTVASAAPGLSTQIREKFGGGLDCQKGEIHRVAASAIVVSFLMPDWSLHGRS